MDGNLGFWQRNARFYTALQEKSNHALYEEVIRRCRPYLTPESRVLELACGTGQFTLPLCGQTAAWEATDFSPEMIRRAQRRSTAARFSVEDATALSFADGSFDVVLIANALHILPEPLKALAEIKRVLVPGGILLAPTFVHEGKRNRGKLWLLEKAGFRTFHKWTCGTFREFLEENGFQVLELERIPGKLLPEAFAAAERSS